MGKRWSWMAWSMLAVFAVGLAFTAVLGVLNGTDAGNRAVLLYLPAFTAFMVVGALVVPAAPPTALAGCSRPSPC
jgi:peptidoglycan/LPS O-acetylase OafA/YrhL